LPLNPAIAEFAQLLAQQLAREVLAEVVASEPEPHKGTPREPAKPHGVGVTTTTLAANRTTPPNR
jgi:hypothetical protein